jgi:hypothetical protein
MKWPGCPGHRSRVRLEFVRRSTEHVVQHHRGCIARVVEARQTEAGFPGATGRAERRRRTARLNVKSEIGSRLLRRSVWEEELLPEFRNLQRRRLRDALVADAIAAATVGVAPRVAGAHAHFKRNACPLSAESAPFVRGRVIDLSPAAGRALNIDGLASVSVIVGDADATHANEHLSEPAAQEEGTKGP